MDQFGASPPTLNDFRNFQVVDPNSYEVVRQRLYDYLIMPLAGVQSLTFFSTAIGQGVTSSIGATVGDSKKFSDTNMELGGQLPQGKAILVESIEIIFEPGSSATAQTFLPANPSQFATDDSAVLGLQASDVNIMRVGGWLEFNVSSKNLLREAPLGSFPAKTMLGIDAAIGSISATTPGEAMVINARAMGRPYYVEPMISLTSGLNFEVKLQWPGAVALPSGFNGRIGVVLDGYLARVRQ